MPAFVFSVYSAFDNCFSDDEDYSKDATDIKLLIGGHHLGRPQPYPTLPATRIFSHNPTQTEVKKALPVRACCQMIVGIKLIGLCIVG